MSAQSVFLRSFRPVRYLLSAFFWLSGIGFFVLFGLQFWHPRGMDSWGTIVLLQRWGSPIIAGVTSWLELGEGATRYVPLGLGLALWILQAVVNSTLGVIHRWLVERVPATARAAAPGGLPAPAKVKTADIDLGTPPPETEKARAELLDRYKKIEEALKRARRKACTFLSVDIVGSTKMKTGQGATEIAVTFHSYEGMLKKIFQEYSAWKQAWTPDGVMVCFLQRELAVRAAQRVLQSLDNFNRNYNKLPTPFSVRCGLNEGEVPIYDDTQLERLADRVIDVAGHMQKEAKTNSLWLSAEIFAQLEDKSGFHPSDKVVDGYKVYQWSLEAAAEEPARAAAQPAALAAATLVTAPSAAEAAKLFGRYEVVKELGRGAMGAVYKARDPRIGRTVAVKVILAKSLPEDALAEYKQRFFREAQAAGQMTHPGIVTIHDVGEDAAGQPYLVMEYLEGKTLDHATPPLPNALDIVAQVGRALDYAHGRGVVHRDIKPANIILAADGRAKILDFGIARLEGTQLTRVGQILGTPSFMSPEQFTGAAVDGRSDIFSLGAVLYWLCTGQQAFPGNSLTEVALKVMQSMPASVKQFNPSLPAGTDNVIARCLAKDSSERYASGKELAADLEGLLAGRPVARQAS